VAALSALATYGGGVLLLMMVARTQSMSVSLKSPGALALFGGGAVTLLCDGCNLDAQPILAVMLACAVVCAASDLATGLVFDLVTGSTAAIVLAWALLHQTVRVELLGGYLSIAPLALLHLVTRGRGIGIGDIKLAGVIGGAIGGAGALVAIGAAFVTGACWAVMMLASRKVGRGDTLPFAPFLALGAMMAVTFSGTHAHG
jgi:prepilin signal peptidase PulO-like enzyme (type II secretory pathway)